MDWTATTRRIRKASRLEEIASELGVALKKRGKELVGRCPLPGHQDTDPSFNINPKKQLFSSVAAAAAEGISMPS
jgi:DNA primase